ncbi:hypothetical protein ACG3SL_02825 [Sphingomonas sp. CJ20]
MSSIERAAYTPPASIEGVPSIPPEDGARARRDAVRDQRTSERAAESRERQTVRETVRNESDPAKVETARRVAEAQRAQMVSYCAAGPRMGVSDTGSLFAINA